MVKRIALETVQGLAVIAAVSKGESFINTDALEAGVKQNIIDRLKGLNMVATRKSNFRLMYVTNKGYKQITEVEKLGDFIAKNIQ